MDSMVARGSLPVATQSKRTSASVPARVLRPCWEGMQAVCSSDAYPCASVRPTSRRITSPTTRARARPLGLRRATMRPARMAATTGVTGTSARASRPAARCESVQSASSSSKMRKGSLVMPEGPAAEPRVAVRRDARNGCKGSAHCSSGLNARSSGSGSGGSQGVSLRGSQSCLSSSEEARPLSATEKLTE